MTFLLKDSASPTSAVVGAAAAASVVGASTSGSTDLSATLAFNCAGASTSGDFSMTPFAAGAAPADKVARVIAAAAAQVVHFIRLPPEFGARCAAPEIGRAHV